jgi:hypothetical protein
MSKVRLTKHEMEMFDAWVEDGNVSLVSDNGEEKIYSTQDAQFCNRLNGFEGLLKYFKENFLD